MVASGLNDWKCEFFYAKTLELHVPGRQHQICGLDPIPRLRQETACSAY